MFLLTFAVLVWRLGCMQIVQCDYYEEIVERKRRRVQIYSGPRGTIYDCDGEVLATDMQVFDASFILPKLDPLVAVVPLVCRTAGLSREKFEEHLDLAKLRAAIEEQSVQTLLPEIAPRAAKRLRYLAGKYPEKYGALIVHEREVDGRAVFSLRADLAELCRKEETLRLATAFLGASYDEALKEVNRVEEKISKIANSYQRRYELDMPYTLAKKLSRDQAEEFEVRYRRYPGIVVTTRTQRVHPHGDLACHVLGYLRALSSTAQYEDLKKQGRIIRRGFSELRDFEKIEANPFFHDDSVGASGIERIYQKELQGRKGARLLERDTRTPEQTVLSEILPGPGLDLHLTLSARVQRAAQDAFSEEGLAGAAVVMDVKTGAVIALASAPGYDLDTFRRDQSTFNKHLQEPYPLVNRALSAVAPGSGFKLVTALAALEEGAITPQTHFY